MVWKRNFPSTIGIFGVHDRFLGCSELLYTSLNPNEGPFSWHYVFVGVSQCSQDPWYFGLHYSYMYIHAPLKTNVEPENGPLEEEIPFGNPHFQVYSVHVT